MDSAFITKAGSFLFGGYLLTVFVYDNTKIDQFTTFQGGDITVGSSENIDYGDIVDNVEPERDENFFFVNDWGLITLQQMYSHSDLSM